MGFYLNPSHGVLPGMSMEDYRDLNDECFRVIQDWDISKRIQLESDVRDQWENLFYGRLKARIFRKGSCGLKKGEENTIFSPSTLIRQGKFGVHLPTRFISNSGEPVFVLAWIQKGERQRAPLCAYFEIVDGEANRFSLINRFDWANLKFALKYLYRSFSFEEFDRKFIEKFRSHRISVGNTEFVYDTGFLVKNEVLGTDIPQGVPIKILVYPDPEDDSNWNLNLYFNDAMDPLFEILDCLPSLYRFVRPSAIDWQKIGTIADTSAWDLDSNKETLDKALRTYLEFTFERLCDDSMNEDGKSTNESRKNRFPPFIPQFSPAAKCSPASLLFCTGLVERASGNFIYGCATDLCAEDNRYGKIEWLFHDDPKSAPNPSLKGDLTVSPLNHGLPYPADWTREPERLIFDYCLGSLEQDDVIIDYAHLFFDHLVKERPCKPENKRFPDFVEKQFEDCVFPSIPSGSDRKNLVPKKFKDMIDKAWRKTRKILQGNYKVAVPTYYRRKIQLLVPLYLDDLNDKKPTVALVVSKNSDEEKKKYHGSSYFCPTCLTLEAARNNSRVITPLRGTWLER